MQMGRRHISVIWFCERGRISAIWTSFLWGDSGSILQNRSITQASNLKAVTFLHEHKSVHGDMVQQNMFMDVIVPSISSPLLAGLRGPERRYALIDFETARLPPADGSPCPTELEKASKNNVCSLTTALEINLRVGTWLYFLWKEYRHPFFTECIEDVIPDLAHLFDSMKDPDSPNQPTAASSLARFEEICMTLKEEDFERQVEATRWIFGEWVLAIFSHIHAHLL